IYCSPPSSSKSVVVVVVVTGYNRCQILLLLSLETVLASVLLCQKPLSPQTSCRKQLEMYYNIPGSVVCFYKFDI
ncbi:hypothetical protein Tco_0074688, partial [Tanacetum coccineum]